MAKERILSTENRTKLGIRLSEAGDALFENLKYNKAIKLYNIAISIFKSTGESKWITLMQRSIVECYIKKQDYKKAIRFSKKALVIQLSTKDLRGASSSLFNLGFCYQYQDTNTALSYFKMATSWSYR